MISRKVPLLSVVMSVYNTPLEYLRESFKSVLDQSFSDFEFIVVDDCSEEFCSKEIENQADNDARIIVIKNETNLGLTKSLNKAISLVRGKYIARMDADDVCEEKRFEKQIKYLERRPNVAVLGSFKTFIDEQGKKKKEFFLRVLFRNLIKRFRTSRQLDTLLFFHNVLAHPSVMMRTSLFHVEGFHYDDNYKTSQDYELWSRIQKTHKITCLPYPLLRYRSSPTQITRTKAHTQYQTHYRVIFRQLSKLSIDPTEQEKTLHSLLCGFTNHKTNINECFDSVKFNLWCDRLITQNNKIKVFDCGLFEFTIRFKQIQLFAKHFKQFGIISVLFELVKLTFKLSICSVKLFF